MSAYCGLCWQNSSAWCQVLQHQLQVRLQLHHAGLHELVYRWLEVTFDV
jgi:hypothetical protein